MTSLAENLEVIKAELELRGNRCSLCGKAATIDTIDWHHIAVARDADGKPKLKPCGCLVIDKERDHEIAVLKRKGREKLKAELKKCIPLCQTPCHLNVCHGH
jgi:hypothetical protein